MNNLNRELIMQAQMYIDKGDYRRAMALGFSHEELRRIANLTTSEVEAVARVVPNLARFQVDHRALETALNRTSRETETNEQVDRCIKLGASVEMLGTFFGMTPNRVSARRNILGLNRRLGRLPMPDEKADHSAWKAWQTISPDPDDSRAHEDLASMMQLAEETELLLTVVWTLVKQWTQPDIEHLSSIPGEADDQSAEDVSSRSKQHRGTA
ncbi:DUF2857 domain-containing protein [Carnimonas bestiolae]|uniref:DUF2857 domain-containing protein n=1 Tax=Carnimonas bestiolae TaxID=3402172 RepID=UPI003EDBFFAC